MDAVTGPPPKGSQHGSAGPAAATASPVHVEARPRVDLDPSVAEPALRRIEAYLWALGVDDLPARQDHARRLLHDAVRDDPSLREFTNAAELTDRLLRKVRPETRALAPKSEGAVDTQTFWELWLAARPANPAAGVTTPSRADADTDIDIDAQTTPDDLLPAPPALAMKPQPLETVSLASTLLSPRWFFDLCDTVRRRCRTVLP